MLLIRTDSREIIYPQIKTRVHRMNWIWYGDALNFVITSFIWVNFYCPNINTTICHINRILLPKLIVYGVTLVSVYFLTGEKSSCYHSCRLSKCNLIYFPSGRTYMKETVKNMMNRRRQEEHKDETLFLDSILDCDLMDEEEVTADAHLLSVFEGFLPKRPFSPQNPKSEVIIPKTTLRECNKVLSVLYCRRM